MALSFLEKFKAARRVSTPIVIVTTPDPAATYGSISRANMELAIKNGVAEPPILLWDMISGLRGINKVGDDVAKAMLKDVRGKFENQVAMLVAAITAPYVMDGKQMVGLPKWSILFFSNVQRVIQDPLVIQAIWNLRDAFKQNTRTFVGLCPDIKLPPELQHDVLVLDEPLPDVEQLTAIIRETYAAAALKPPVDSVIDRAVEATAGLAAFPAEQRCAMSITKQGMDIEALWEHKRQQIEQTPGLSISRTKEKFENVTGLENAKNYHAMRGNGPKRRRAVVFIDEIDKHIAGFGATGTGDTTTEMVGALLTEMEDQKAEGSLFLGVAGAGKTLLARAIGNEWGVPIIQFDLRGMKGSLVGQSGANISNALKVVRAVSQGHVYYIATCNKIDNLPPELRRRFTSATFFFDLQTKAERDAAWTMYEKKFELTSDQKKDRPNDSNWTAAEIRNCCYNAHVLSCPLTEAAQFIVPIAQSAKEQIDTLRRQADQRFISASTRGLYTDPTGIEEQSDDVVVVGVGVTKRRKITPGDKESAN